MIENDKELPSPLDLPVPETGSYAAKSEPVKQQGSERNPEFHVPNTGLHQGSAQTSQQQPVQHDADSASAGVSGAQSSVKHITGSSPAIADDADLIEKEWVEKAKEIVEKTKDNPYLQNKAINEIKSDYIKKRYNKEVKSEK